MPRITHTLGAVFAISVLANCGGRAIDTELLAGSGNGGRTTATNGNAAGGATTSASHSGGSDRSGSDYVAPPDEAAGGTAATLTSDARTNGGTKGPNSSTPTFGGSATGGTKSSGGAAAGGAPASTSSMATGGIVVEPAPTCTKTLNLLSGDLGPNGNWIGGEPKSTEDNPCGVQGLIYIMGDSGIDGIAGNADDTCPFMDQTVSPCADGHCCVKGKTHILPMKEGKAVYDERIWGCGIGISLNDPWNGNGTNPYSGPAQGFVVELSGILNGQPIRISYTQTAETSTSPFAPGNIRSVSVQFTDPECPSWATDCTRPGNHPHALQVWAVGGEIQDDFEFCIDAIYPIL